MAEHALFVSKEFLIKIGKGDSIDAPADLKIFMGDNTNILSEEHRDTFHELVAKGLFSCESTRPDTQPVMSVLCTQVKKSGKKDWGNLCNT